MTAATFDKLGASPPLAAFAAPDAAAGLPGSTLPHPDAAGAGSRNDGPFRGLEAVVTGGGRAVLDLVRGLREGLTRRQAVRELRLMGRSRLADLGIEPDAIEHVADALLAARRRDRLALAPRFRRRGIADVEQHPPIDATASRSPRDSAGAKSPTSNNAR